MRRFTYLTGVALALLTVGASPALASSSTDDTSAAVAAGTAAAKPTIVVSKSTPDLTAMLSIIDKLFPPQPDPDPARLALARTSAQTIWPDGAYARALSGFIGGAFDRAMQLKESDFAAFDRKAATASPAASSASLHDKAAANDPYFDQRVAAIRAILNEEVGKISAVLDPKMRDGLARAMARRFDAQQLSDLNAFFATPSGHAFGGQYIQLWVDPDVIRSIFGSMPEMMKLMPEMMQKVKEANDKFPKPPKAAETHKPPEKTAKPTPKKAKH